MKKQCWLFRIFFYILSLLILALGLTLNTKTGLGVSPIISVSYSISQIFHLNFGNTTLVWYTVFVIAQLIIRGKNRRWYDLLQIPLSIVFTRFLNLFEKCIPWETDSFAANMALLIVAIICTGVGAAMSVNMRLIPNPGDGIVAAIADFIHKDMGFAKNMFDLLNICMTFVIGIISGHFLLGIGVGTVFAVIGVGRAVAAFNYLCKEKMNILSGLSANPETCTQ
ncbi:hypothetical protein B5E53_12230 [Eubacterium sp. An11]|uniref:YczE/YyaS/YitT family protein n=1 Tax=Eubacterium sp. An11 TaxID=1965542 RepID=UPI000B380E6C|nr:DUF6198 family protein [Eubacterium sp. An11]OUQ65635.1 hypothetical protein B5E53_12230 [Eubacterium sp. An11]